MTTDLTPHQSPRWRWLKWLAIVPVLLLTAEMLRVLAYTNRHTVIEGRVYRCAQPSAENVREQVKARGIRTVINLRGLSPETEWYKDECAACHDLNVSQEDVRLSANRLPPPAELRRLVDVLDHTEYPILIHCKAGADRTGLVSMMALLLQTDTPLDVARRQLWPRFGHFRFGRTAAIDHFFDFYDAWLEKERKSHTSANFRDWVLHHYVPGPAASKLTWLEPIPNPVYASHSFGIRVRAENLSQTPWQLKPGTYAGIHMAYAVFDKDGNAVWSGRTGLREETVPPGGSTEVLVPVIGLKPGQYKLVVDMHDATSAGIPFRTNSFVQFGDDSLAADLLVK